MYLGFFSSLVEPYLNWVNWKVCTEIFLGGTLGHSTIETTLIGGTLYCMYSSRAVYWICDVYFLGCRFKLNFSAVPSKKKLTWNKHLYSSMHFSYTFPYSQRIEKSVLTYPIVKFLASVSRSMASEVRGHQRGSVPLTRSATGVVRRRIDTCRSVFASKRPTVFWQKFS